MKPRFLLLLGVLLAAAPLAWAQGIPGTPPLPPELGGPQPQSTQQSGIPDDSYIPTDSGLGLPSGLIGIGIGQPTPFTNPLPTTLPSTEELQGCGTVGIDDYSSQLFNNPNTFKRFSEQDVNSDLAKQLLTYNYSMPQTAALFAQLNQFGNERYRQFQQGCVLSAQQADARAQYVRECVAATVNSSDITEDSLKAAATTTSTTPPDAETLKARRTARAFELCTQQYTTRTRDLLKQSTETYATAVRNAQDINRALRPLLCPFATPVRGNTEPANGDACWPNLFLPQVRLLAEGVAGTKPEDFGVRAAPLTANTFMDGLHAAVGNKFNSQVLTPFRLMMSGIDQSTLTLAAQTATRNISTVSPSAQVHSRDFRVDYLNCKDADITLSLKELAKILDSMAAQGTQNKQGAQGPTQTGQPLGFTPNQFGVAEYEPIANRMVPDNANLGDALRADRMDLDNIMEIAAGCAANQQVPFLDPMLVVNLNSCETDDQNALFAMAAYDVAATGTRNALNYTKYLLERTLGQLEAGDVNSLRALASNNKIPDSPAMRARLATAVRTIMLPHIEQQLTRLEDFEKTRGVFAKRVEKIYKNKAGCMFSGAANDGGGFDTGGGF